MRCLLYLICLLLLATPALADWELYDDFNADTGGVPLVSKWNYTNGNVTVENGQMKIVFKTTDSADLRPGVYHNDTNNIYGIKFDYTIASWSEAVEEDNQPKFRITKTLGDYPDPFFTKATMQVASMPHDTAADKHHFYAEFSIEDNPDTTYHTVSYNWHDYRNDTYIGVKRTMGAVVASKGMTAFLDDQLSKVYFDTDIPPNGWPFGITIRPRNVGDEMTVLIDNVYVYRGEPADFDAVCPGTAGGAVVIPMF